MLGAEGCDGRPLPGPAGLHARTAAAAATAFTIRSKHWCSAAQSSGRPSPERYIVGCADPRQPLHPALASLLEAFGCPILPMRYESAELAKIAINFCLVASISVANTLAEVCEHDRRRLVRDRAGAETRQRIGQYAYLAPGLGIAGGNLERDLRDGH